MRSAWDFSISDMFSRLSHSPVSSRPLSPRAHHYPNLTELLLIHFSYSKYPLTMWLHVLIICFSFFTSVISCIYFEDHYFTVALNWTSPETAFICFWATISLILSVLVLLETESSSFNTFLSVISNTVFFTSDRFLSDKTA